MNMARVLIHVSDKRVDAAAVRLAVWRLRDQLNKEGVRVTHLVSNGVVANPYVVDAGQALSIQSLRYKPGQESITTHRLDFASPAVTSTSRAKPKWQQAGRVQDGPVFQTRVWR